MIFIFFFSSRRRHTRCSRDWSSDVCSSDLVTNHPGGFNDKEFNSTVVLRWEYRPGSTLFVVWTQGRADYTQIEGPRSLAGNFRDMFDLHPNNTFLVKASYWINW